MANILGFNQNAPEMPRVTLLDTLSNMALSNFVSAKVQAQQGTNEAHVRITNTTKQKTLDTAGKNDPKQNDVPQATNLGNCQGPATKFFFTKDTPA
jgi:hypothetical protein